MATKVIHYKGAPKGILEVDDEDSDILNKTWYFDFSNQHRGSKYFRIKRVATASEKASGSTRFVKIHKEIWEKYNGPVPEGYEIDHLDHNTLNNRKNNLSLKSHLENSKRIRKKFQASFIE